MDAAVEGQSLQNETECCIVNPREGVIVIEVKSFPRLLPFVMWRKYRDTEIFTKVGRFLISIGVVQSISPVSSADLENHNVSCGCKFK